ncbi:MAG: hypothetical protein HIU91_10385 [Acidobacteria bacterium]|nr:hypothetical protein [Acidobacteriota bacterium]
MTVVGVAAIKERSPSSLHVEDFGTYSAGAASFAEGQLSLLRTLPLSLCVVLLKQISRYDTLFPAEREDLSQLLRLLGSQQMATTISDFKRIVLSEDLRRRDWIRDPGRFVEEMTAELWTSDQIDGFRQAAAQLTPPVEPPPRGISRLMMVDFDSRLEKPNFVLFRRLLEHGTLFTNVTPGLENDPFTASLKILEDRARAQPGGYSHWLISGDSPPQRPSSAVSALDYKSLEPIRHGLLNLMSAAVNAGTSGPEALRSIMMELQPEALGLTSSDPHTSDALLAQFSIDLLGQGSGTQIYSTTFVQWSAREVLRRARPATALIRFTPRVLQRPTNQQWSRADADPDFDLAGSLVDADMAAYYTWINLNRMPGSNSNVFVAFHSGLRRAFASGPGLLGGTSSDQAISPSDILSLLQRS